MQVPKIILFLSLLTTLVIGLSAYTNLPDKEKSLKSFDTILKVLKSPRCINCHPSDDFPRQGDQSIIHRQGIERGIDGHGLVVQRCQTCHQEENNSYSNVPGAPNWHLAPLSMGWTGLSDAELGKALLDKGKNGGKTPEELVKHMSEDKLVLWAWQPGEGRTAPPVPLDQFRQALKDWLENGAHIPKE